MGLQNRLLLWSLLLFGLAGLLFSGVSDAAPAKGWVLVNSNNFADVVGGAVYASQNGYSYAFVLTPSHGDYLVNFFKASSGKILYYESGTPVSATMGNALKALSKPNVQLVNNADLAGWFASKSPAKLAYVVGSADGAESLSVAPYAVLMKGGLYFADASNVDALIAGLKSKGQAVTVYGSIASSASAASLSGTEAINSGSRYADNLQVLSKFMSAHPVKQVLFISGKTFEKSMIDPANPLMLMGRTEVSNEQLAWLRGSGITASLVFQGDADIQGSVDEVKKSTGLPVFAKLGEGYTGDAQMQPLAVMTLPGPNVVLSVSTVKYNGKEGSLQVTVKNDGNVPANVRVSATLPDGSTGSSAATSIAKGASKTISVPVDASRSVQNGQIAQATILVASSAQASFMDAIDSVNITKISADMPPKPAPKTEPPAPVAQPPAQPPAPAKGGDSSLLLIVVAVVIIAVGAYLLMSGKKK